MAEFIRRVVTYRLYSKLLDLEQALNGNNENLVQRELGKLHEALEYNSEKVAEYFEESLVAEEIFCAVFTFYDAPSSSVIGSLCDNAFHLFLLCVCGRASGSERLHDAVPTYRIRIPLLPCRSLCR